MKKNKRLNFIFTLIIITVNLSIFLPSMKGDFLWDDKYFITENPHISAPHFLKKFLVTPFGGFSGTDENSIRLDRSRQFYRPLTSLSYWLDRKTWGFNPAGFHLTNILIQILNTIIIYFILQNLGLNILTSLFSTLLFSVFPFHFENVSWISGRTDLLSFLFASISILFFLKFLKKNHYLSLAFSSFFYLCSLLSKENTIFLFFIFFFILYASKPRFKDSAIPMIPFVFSFLLWFILRNIAMGSPGYEPSGRTLFDFFSTIGFYSLRLFFPFLLSLTVDSYKVFNNVLLQIFGGIITMLFLISAILLLIKKLKNTSPALAFVSYYLLLLPSVVIIFASSTASYIAWRFLYLPSALFLTCLAFILLKKMKLGPVSIVLLSLLFLFYAVEMYPKNKIYGKDETDFWLSFKDTSRENLLARFNVGVTYLPRDEKKAMEIFNSILSQKEHHLYSRYEVKIYEDLFQYFTFKKNFNMAEKYFNKLIKLRKEQSQHFYFIYAFFLAFKGKISEGEKIVVEMLNFFPKNHLVLIYSAKFYIIIKNYEKASTLLTRDYDLFPTRETYKLLQKLKEEKNQGVFSSQRQ